MSFSRFGKWGNVAADWLFLPVALTDGERKKNEALNEVLLGLIKLVKSKVGFDGADLKVI